MIKLFVVFLCVGIVALNGCKPAQGIQGMRGVELPKPIARPDFILEDTEGKPFDFKARTRGRLTFLMFGYTNCPDVCPIHMNGLSKALSDLSYEDRKRIDVIFVTTDPERDSAQKLRKWLNEADASFIGLRGNDSIVAGAQQQVGAALAAKSEPDEKGNYDVGHASQMYVFTPDDSAHRVYPFGTRKSDWEHDLPVLLRK